MKIIFGCYVLLIFTLVGACNLTSRKDYAVEEDLEFHDLSNPELNFLNDELGANPNNDELLYQRSDLLLSMGNISVALTDINKAIQINNVAGKYYLLLYKILHKNAQYNLALNALKKYEMLEPSHLEVLIYMAKVYLNLGNFNQAEVFLNKAIVQIPNHADIPYLQGKIIQMKGDSISPISFFKTSLAKNYKHEEAIIALSEVYLKDKKYDSTIYYSLLGNKYYSRNPFFLFQMAQVFETTNWTASAIHNYKESLKIDSAYVPSLRALANIFQKNGDDNLSIPLLTTILKLHSLDVNANLLLGNILYKQNRVKESMKFFKNYLIVEPNDAKIKSIYEQLKTQYPEPIDNDLKVNLDTSLISKLVDSVIVKQVDTTTKIIKKKKSKVLKTDIDRLMNSVDDLELPPTDNVIEETNTELNTIVMPQTIPNEQEAGNNKKIKSKKRNKKDSIQ